MPISVAIADDHAVVREGITCLLRDFQIAVVAGVGSGKEAVECLREIQPDVLLLDVRLGAEYGGLETLEAIRDGGSSTRVIMISNYDNPTYVARTIALGADEYLLKSCSQELLVETIRRVHEKMPVADASPFAQVSNLMAKNKNDGKHNLPLTVRESQVLRHIALGLSNREIARSLQISVETVKEHVQNLLRKIDANDRTQAAVWAVRQKLV